jgi:hypothetical protein
LKMGRSFIYILLVSIFEFSYRCEPLIHTASKKLIVSTIALSRFFVHHLQVLACIVDVSMFSNNNINGIPKRRLKPISVMIPNLEFF